jgi:hypothetical protein
MNFKLSVENPRKLAMVKTTGAKQDVMGRTPQIIKNFREKGGGS